MPELESRFKKKFLNDLEDWFKEQDIDYDIFKIDSRSKPDHIICGPRGRWAALEFKRLENASQQANQEYHVRRMNHNGFARFVYPGNSKEVRRELEQLFSS